MSTRERLEAECRLDGDETIDETNRVRVLFYIGDLRKLLAVLDAARACNGRITTYGEQHLTDDLSDAVQECDEP